MSVWVREQAVKAHPWRPGTPGPKGDLWPKGDLIRYLASLTASNFQRWLYPPTTFPETNVAARLAAHASNDYLVAIF